MNYDSITTFYTESDPTVVSFYVAVIDGKTLGIPADPANTDYQEYLAWLAEGNEPTPADSE